jgi:hypothetical protein
MAFALLLLRRAGLYLAMVVAMLSIGDEFPFSHFPMYGKLPDTVISIRLLDAKGALISTEQSFHLPTSTLKKHIVRELAELKSAGKIQRTQDSSPAVMREVGQKVLDWMLQHYAPQVPELSAATVQLEARRYRVIRGKIDIVPEIVATGRAQPFTPAPQP